MKLFCSALILGMATLVACDRTYITNPVQPAPVTPTVPVVSTNKIEFRVVGNANSVRVRYSDPIDGLTQTVTTLPFFATFSTDQKSMFLSLDVTPLGYSMGTIAPFVAAQIVVNGSLFREATSSDFLMSTLSVFGTWRQ